MAILRIFMSIGLAIGLVGILIGLILGALGLFFRQGVVNLVHGLKAQVVGEGVEREEQMEVLRATGVDLVQGYAFAEPMSEGEFTRWVASRAGNDRTALSA